MFGYIRPYVPNLLVSDYEYYKAVYCALCREHGKFGATSRTCLSYDGAFLVLLRQAVCGETGDVMRARCAAYPPAKRNMTLASSHSLLAAAASVILAEQKVADDKADERGIKRFAAYAAHPIAASWAKKATDEFEGLETGIRERLRIVYETEREMTPDNASVDRPASAFGEVTAFAAAYELSGHEKLLAEAIGRSVGSWVYCIDALDDLAEDASRGRFNPFLLFDPTAGDIAAHEVDTETVKLAVVHKISDAVAAADLISENSDASKDRARRILLNVLTEGIPHVTELVAAGKLPRGGVCSHGRSRLTEEK